MRVLITDSFSSSNRGDAAILDAMVRGLSAEGAHVSVVSHFPAVAKLFHGIEAIDDRDPRAVALAIANADFVVSCGGSFLHDLYAPNLNSRLATLHAARRAGVPYAIFGQSIGPLVHPLSRQAVREVLDGAALICVRDEASARVVADLGVGAPLRIGVDAAVLGRVQRPEKGAGPVLGVTVRHWHFPEQADPEARQEAYEAEVAAACDAWLSTTGGQVRFFSNCTSFGGYRQDDRVTARRVAARMRHDAQVIEADDVEFSALRGECGACDFFLGTRMHSLIFATTAGVPSVGIAYEQKTYEWMRQVGLGDDVLDIAAPQGLAARLLSAWERRDQSACLLTPRIDAMVATAREDMAALVAVAGGHRPLRAHAERKKNGGWDGETWRFDVPHRRLRQVADIVLGEGGQRVLDLGCSTGLLGRMLGPAYDYTGIDLAPSVATERERFRIRTSSLDEFSTNERYDTVVASGSLEYVNDLEGVLASIRAALQPGGLAVLTLFNLAHISRAVGLAPRHPTWTLQERPDEFVLALYEAGLAPQRVMATSAGYGPAPAIHEERPTDAEIDGMGQLAPERMLRLAHHWIVVCRAGEAQPGLRRMAAELEAGHLPEALRLGVSLAQRFPWAPRIWSDLAVAWYAADRPDKAGECLARAIKLDPARPDVLANAEALDLSLPELDAEQLLMLAPEDGDAWVGLVRALTEAGKPAAARVVAEMRRRPGTITRGGLAPLNPTSPPP